MENKNFAEVQLVNIFNLYVISFDSLYNVTTNVIIVHRHEKLYGYDIQIIIQASVVIILYMLYYCTALQ